MDLITEFFTKLQFQLIMYCAMAAATGGFIKSIVISYNFDVPHHLQEKFESKSWSAAFSNIIARLLVSALSGLIYALFMVSAIKMEQSAIAKLIVVSVVVGYLAPDLWKTQEKRMLDRLSRGLEDSVKSAFNKQKQSDS